MMAQRLDLAHLPERPLDAAAAFASRYLSRARALSAGDLVVLFAHADHTHESWRRAAGDPSGLYRNKPSSQS